MDILILIGLNLFSVPFLQQAELRGRVVGHWPACRDIARLRDVRRMFWFKPFCVLLGAYTALLLVATWVVEPEIGGVLPINFLIMQVLLWGAVMLAVRAHRASKSGSAAKPLVPSTGIEPVSES
ncbi:hypothetical protein VARIO8X_120219 [Burkholderiales bacterium 8X]|nr:hypothetical protein VARIO8X_120219 [Burkholderiales bacterium 8X]